MPRWEVSLGWGASRNRDSETGHFHAFHFAGRVCVREGRHRRHSAGDQAVRVADGISIRLAQDR
jgi:hypothetical protein